MAYKRTSPFDGLSVSGHVDFVHVAGGVEDHALEVDCDAAGFGDVKAIEISYISGAISAVDDADVIKVNIDETASTGGEIAGYEVVSTSQGSATINGYTTGVNINPILHNSGAFGNADDILNKAVDVTAALASGGAGNITVFVLNSETMTFGDAAQFNEMEMILDTVAGGGGISPTFEYSTGGTGFSSFTPADGTNGLRNTGAILWVAADLAGWIANATGFFEVKMTRNRVNLPTIPILDEVQIVSATIFTWDSSGDVTVNSIALTTDLTVANGGTGASTLTGVLTGNGTSAFTVSTVTDNTVVMGSTSNLLQDTTITVTDNGEMVNASQPAFLAVLGTSDADVTGDGTVVLLGNSSVMTVLTEIYDQNSDFTVGGAGVAATFTAPVTGRYHFEILINLAQLGDGHTLAQLRLITTNRTYDFATVSPGGARASSNVYALMGSTYADMDATETAHVTFMVDNSTKTVDLVGTAGGVEFVTFSGALIC